MKFRFNYRLLTISRVLLIVVLQSCQIETSDNGNLDGYWHMESVDTLATGGMLDLSESRIFWAFQVKLMRLTDRDGHLSDVNMRFSHEGNVLKVYDPYLSYGHETENSAQLGGDTPLQDASILAPYAIDSLQQNFQVEVLNSQHMILKSNKFRLKFTKF